MHEVIRHRNTEMSLVDQMTEHEQIKTETRLLIERDGRRKKFLIETKLYSVQLSEVTASHLIEKNKN